MPSITPSGLERLLFVCAVAATIHGVELVSRYRLVDRLAAELLEPEVGESARYSERLRVADSAPKPLVMGRHLVDLGMKPGPEFGRLLKAAYEAQLDGRFSTAEEGVALICNLLSRGV